MRIIKKLSHERNLGFNKARIEYSKHGIGGTFNRPANITEINLLQSKFGKEIPLEFIEYLNVFNGQQHDNFDFQPFSYYALLPINEIIAIVDAQKQLWEEEDEINNVKENKIQPKIWDENWIPFASDGSSYLILDLASGKNGAYGQIFQLFNGMDYEDDEVVIAGSFKEFSTTLLQKLKDRDYELEEDEEIILFNNHWI